MSRARWALGWARWRYWGLALSWRLLGREKALLALLDDWLAHEPQHTWALAARMLARQQSGQLALALADAQTLHARYLEQASAPARVAAVCFNQGYLLEQQGALEPAAQAFEAALRHQPTLDSAWYGLGLVRLRQAQWPAAQAALTRCTELQALSPHAWYQLARLHAQQGRRAQAEQITRHLQTFEPAAAAQLAHQLGLGADFFFRSPR